MTIITKYQSIERWRLRIDKKNFDNLNYSFYFAAHHNSGPNASRAGRQKKSGGRYYGDPIKHPEPTASHNQEIFPVHAEGGTLVIVYADPVPNNPGFCRPLLAGASIITIGRPL